MTDVPLPFDLPPSPSTASRTSPGSADPTTTTPEHVTDLPLSLRGNGGNDRVAVHLAEAATLRQLLAHLEALASIPRPPSVDEFEWSAVRSWVEEAAHGLVSRREGLKLVRQVERVLAEQSRTALQIMCTTERIERRIFLAEERAAGTHWKRRDAGRRAKRPTHVDVDPHAWRQAKVAAVRRGVTIGHYVGSLLHETAERGLPIVDADATTTVRLFARLDVDEQTWDQFRGICGSRGVTAARGVGWLVESCL